MESNSNPEKHLINFASLGTLDRKKKRIALSTALNNELKTKPKEGNTLVITKAECEGKTIKCENLLNTRPKTNLMGKIIKPTDVSREEWLSTKKKTYSDLRFDPETSSNHSIANSNKKNQPTVIGIMIEKKKKVKPLNIDTVINFQKSALTDADTKRDFEIGEALLRGMGLAHEQKTYEKKVTKDVRSYSGIGSVDDP